MGINEAIEKYIDALKTDGKSATTVKGYAHDLKLFGAWLDDISSKGGIPGAGVSAVAKNTLEKYAQFLKTSGAAPATANRRIIAVRKFFEYLAKEGVIETNPAADLKTKPVQRQNTVKWLDRNEVGRVLYACETQPHAGLLKKTRDKALIMVLVNCGLRVSELCDLQLDDLDYNASLLTVRDGKGAKYRKVPFGKSTQAAVKTYLDMRESQSSYVFVTERGDQTTPRAVQHVVKKLSEISGVDFTVHSLRHTYGKNIADETGGRLEVVAQLLGHATIETTRIYVTPSMKELTKAAEAVEFE
ncbi:tyrosine-type recombinase/integrase [Paenibacillus sp. GD4]|uniref:tyrosine-type recombinase/integrase n=1 Tax=Paenibacillus sp. GD4 TaxID=3068890 RepID=UPI0027965AED|nr:tyrosine-type recombinase/integrase [Paenibacillus sp. GD4]MDQ1913275.1 tyrosine-type recombinase/integrase [Paenibacillus sp. GD4]